MTQLVGLRGEKRKKRKIKGKISVLSLPIIELRECSRERLARILLIYRMILLMLLRKGILDTIRIAIAIGCMVRKTFMFLVEIWLSRLFCIEIMGERLIVCQILYLIGKGKLF